MSSCPCKMAKREEIIDNSKDRLSKEVNRHENPNCIKSQLYMDYNATTPMAPEVKASIVDAMEEGWGNPSSGYLSGQAAKVIVDTARGQVAKMINASSAADVIFSSGGTEADNWVIHSAVLYFHRHRNEYVGRDDSGTATGQSKPHVITTTFEHDAIKLPLEGLQGDGKAEVTFLPPINGQVTADSIISAIKPTTCLVTIMLANNETGVIQPVPDITHAISSRFASSPRGRIFLHTDAAQAIGKITVDVQRLGVDFLTVVGHKFYGPRVGALYVKNPILDQEQAQERDRGGSATCNGCDGRPNSERGKASTPLFPMFFGGGQERGLRPGTENTPMIAGLGTACHLVTRRLSADERHLGEIRDRLENRLAKSFNLEEPCMSFNGNFSREDGTSVPRLPNTCNVSFRPPLDMGKRLVSGREILASCGIAASVGAACHGSSSRPSPILLAFGVTVEDATSAVRLSLGRNSTEEEVDLAVDRLKQAYDALYGLVPELGGS